ncbi:subunit 17 of mediator complex-domain-containing protein [Trametes punicea]|nr:subunit 17 of mediator complex-domain-containing protein [Trametes punicea]
MEEPPWKKLKLSLERPYKDDHGEPLHELLDITPDGQHIYRPREDPTAAVGTKLRRIFLERGLDLFETTKGSRTYPALQTQDAAGLADHAAERGKHAESSHTMSPEELYKMRMSLLPQLYVAFGEMCQARDLLTLLLSSSLPSQPSSLPPAPLAATVVDKPPPILSVRAFDAQLTIGGKDKSLRAAADLFKSAAMKIEESRLAGERYWLDALKIRRRNWGLLPAPLPFGAATGKGADKTSKDFLISFGLEESPPLFRRRAVGRIAALNVGNNGHPLEFPLRQRTRLRVSLTRAYENGTRQTCHSRLTDVDDGSLDGALRAAQVEVVEQEIFSTLIKEASSLPTASAEVSERLILIDAAQSTEIRFELVDGNSVARQTGDHNDPLCDFVYFSLHILVLRAHSASKAQRLSKTSIARSGTVLPPPPPAPLLQPIIEILQYREFWERVRDEVDRVVSALRLAGVSARVHYNPVADSGEALLVALQSEKSDSVGGEVLLRIDERHTLRFTTSSPSTLTAHLPQATLSIASISQLTQLLVDEISSCLLRRICEIGTERCDKVNETWFVDLLSGRSVGRWEGCILDFRISFKGAIVECSASRANREGRASHIEAYRPGGQLTLFEWVRHIIDSSLGR